MKKILITGGTGSLGQALTKRLYGEYDITIFSRDETKQGKMRKLYPECRYILGDVGVLEDLELAFNNIDIVYHFAAYKQVPSAQNNILTTLRTNILGSKNVVYAAIKAGVKQVVASSTDKSCAAANFYGTSKNAMECIFQDANKHGSTTFHLARYGNVVCSNASVVPLFQEQSAAGGPLTVTRLEMTRFWIGLNTAVDLIQHALTTAPGIVVVPAAKALGIVEVAKAIGGDLSIKEIGIRAGEKIHEAMISQAESFHTECVGEITDVVGIDTLFYIHPPTEHYNNISAPYEYTSDVCDVLTKKEFLDMIYD